MRSSCLLAVGAGALSALPAPARAQPEPPPFWVREGYALSVAVDDLRGARYLEFDDRGALYVARPQPGDITAFFDDDGDGFYERRATFLDNVSSVVGLDFAHGWLWFATSGSIARARDNDGDGRADDVETIIPEGQLPSGGGHWWRPVLITDDAIYTSVGDAGNISDQTDTERQKIWRFNLDGSGKRLFASGIRNTEKLRLRPGTSEIWGFDHGSDWFGAPVGDDRRMRGGGQPITDLNPPDELNHYVEGGFYGHPFVVGNRIPRYEYLKKPDIHELAAKTIPPAWAVPAHWAVNGFTFIDPAINNRTGALPTDHNGDVFFAAHGSWNRSEKAGYCLGRVFFDDGEPYGMWKIVSCLSSDGQTVLGRPVDAAQAPDGSLLFSCDFTHRVYRVRWVGAK